MTVPVLILAGGASTRMGARNKLLEPAFGQPLIRLQAWRALKASRDVSVLVRPDQPEIANALTGLDVSIIIASEAVEGIGGSIRAGTRSFLRQPCFLLMLADLVEIEASDLRKVMNASAIESGPRIWRGATEDGKPGHPILFERHVYDDLLKLSGDNGGKSVIEMYRDQTRLVNLPGQRARFDLDTPEAWDAWHTTRLERAKAG